VLFRSGYSDYAPTGEPEKPEAVGLRDLLGERKPEVRPSITLRKGTESSERITLD